MLTRPPIALAWQPLAAPPDLANPTTDWWLAVLERGDLLDRDQRVPRDAAQVARRTHRRLDDELGRGLVEVDVGDVGHLVAGHVHD